MKKGVIIVIAAMLVIVSCSTTKDLENDTRAQSVSDSMDVKDNPPEIKKEVSPADKAIEEIAATIELEKKLVYVEKPVYVPASVANEDPKVQGYEAGKKVVSNIVEPMNYNGSAMIYDYDENFVYEIYVKTLSTTDIYLQPGEQLVGDLGNSDTVRFLTGKNVSIEKGQQVQHILIKPTDTGLEGTLTIFTNMRTYHCILRSYKTVFMPIVKWRYIESGLPQLTIQQEGSSGIALSNQKDYLDPKYLSFDYKMSFGAFSKPDWTPTHVYDDGKKTYIVFPEQVLQKEIPGCFENNNEILNYRVNENVYIIDKLITKITFKLGKNKVKIWKKRSN